MSSPAAQENKQNGWEMRLAQLEEERTKLEKEQEENYQKRKRYQDELDKLNLQIENEKNAELKEKLDNEAKCVCGSIGDLHLRDSNISSQLSQLSVEIAKTKQFQLFSTGL